MLAVSYANSSALSTTHYKLVKDVENAQSDQDTLRIVSRCLGEIKGRWKTGANSRPSSIRRDLLLVLYCHETIQGLEQGHLSREDKVVLDHQVFLLAAVQLAGRGEGVTEEERGVGYRVCHALFPQIRGDGQGGDDETPHQEPQHPLKLLLDLFTPPSSPRAEARRVLGLRAAASPSIAGPELVPAIAGRVVELLQGGGGVSSPIRRLALEAIQNLLEIGPNARLLERTRSTFYESLTGFISGKGKGPDSISEKARGKRRAVLGTGYETGMEGSIFSDLRNSTGSRTTTTGKDPDPKLVLAFVRATRRNTKGGFYPVFGGEEGGTIVGVCLGILGKVVDPSTAPEGGGWDDKAFEYAGLKCVWLVVGVLERVLEELREGTVEEEEMGRVARELVRVSKWAEGGGKGVRDALLLSISELLSLIPPSHLPTSEDLEPLLTPIASSLQSPSPNSRLFALRTLSVLPASLWSTLSEGSKGWGQHAWSAIMRGLGEPDSMMRKVTLKVLGKVEGSLVGMYWGKVMEGVKMAGRGGDGEAVKVGVERLMEVIEATKKSGEEWAKAIIELAQIVSGQGGQVVPIGEILLPTIERFSYFSDVRTRYEFAKTLLGHHDAWSAHITLALILAGVVHALVSPEEENVGPTILDASKNMLALLDQGAQLAQELQEPFLIALLRLSGSIEEAQQVEELRLLVEGCQGRGATFATRPLFEMLEVGLREGSRERKVVREMGSSGRYGGLTLPAWEGVYRGLVRRVEAEDRKGEEEKEGISTWSPARTKLTQSRSTPLKYDPYTTNTSSPPSTHSRNVSQTSTTSSLQAQRIGISPRALARERQDLLRDRVERGGKGGMGESLLFDERSEVIGGGSSLAGRLALGGFQEGVGEREDEEERQLEEEGDPFRMG